METLCRPVLKDFVAAANKRSYPPRTMLGEAEHRPQSLCLIVEGSVSLLLNNEQGRQFALGYLSGGDFVGETDLFASGPAVSMWARTRRPTVVAEMDYPAFRCYCLDHPEIVTEIAAQLAQKLQSASERLSELAFLDAHSRVYNELRYLATLPDAQNHPQGRIVRIRRYELASLLGLSREYITRSISYLEERGRVMRTPRGIVICEPPVDRRESPKARDRMTKERWTTSAQAAAP